MNLPMRLRSLFVATLLAASCGNDGTTPVRFDGGALADVAVAQPDGGATDTGPSLAETGAPSSTVLERPPGLLPRPPLSGLPDELKPPR
jgi:hypothetical protein